jgi:hypothetical protein
MDFAKLQLAERLGGTLLQAPDSVPLVLVERLARHGAPQVLVLFPDPDALEPALAAVAAHHHRGLDLNLVALLDPGPGLSAALLAHRRRIGSLLCALDSGIPWPEGRPLLAKRLPGRVHSENPLDLAPARLSPLERRLLQDRHPEWPAERVDGIYAHPPWLPAATGWTCRWWPGVDLPAGVEIQVPGIELQTASPLAEVLRAALRAEVRSPVPLLPLDGDPTGLHALAALCPEIQVFRGGLRAWSSLLAGLATLPAPVHFCARC